MMVLDGMQVLPHDLFLVIKYFGSQLDLAFKMDWSLVFDAVLTKIVLNARVEQ